MRLMKKIRRWLGVEELNWWDREDAGPVATLQGAPLAAALRHREEVLFGSHHFNLNPVAGQPNTWRATAIQENRT